MAKLSPVWLPLVVFLASVSSVRGEIMYQFDAPFVYATPGQTVSIAVYLAADAGDSVLSGTPDYDFLTNFGLSSAGVNIDYVLPVPTNPPYVASDADVQPNPAFVADYGGGGGFPFVDVLSGPPIGLVEGLDFSRFTFDGFGVRPGEAEEIIPGQLYRVLIGVFTFTVPANTQPFGITTIQASDFSPLTDDTVAADPFGTVLDGFITPAQLNIITPEPASCLVWAGLAAVGALAGGMRSRRRIG